MPTESFTTVYQNITLFVNCQTIDQQYPDIVDKTGVKLVFGFLYSAVWLLGVLGNCTVLYVALKKKISFTVRTVFITSLAGSDLIVGIMSVPITAIMAFTRVWPFTEALCKSVGYFQVSCVLVSSFTLTTIAIDRYFLILYPTVNYITYGRARLIVVIIWLMGYAIGLPLTAYLTLVKYNETCGLFCEEQWPSTELQRIYGITVALLQFTLPVIISIFCYLSISRRLAKQIAIRKRSTVLPEAERRSINRRKRTNLMMSLMVLFFVSAWLPLNSINVLLRDFELVSMEQNKYFNLVFLLCHLWSMTSLIWNPVIYSFFNDSFRTALKAWLFPLRLWYNKRREHSSRKMLLSSSSSKSHKRKTGSQPIDVNNTLLTLNFRSR